MDRNRACIETSGDRAVMAGRVRATANRRHPPDAPPGTRGRALSLQ
ncbi:hypothetical protein BVI2075_1410012 [Burkholderia vietnamiensis]|nr:hypothetical protein BVI2075_1410012 [Burkholderia vietnamiensis]